MNARLPAPRRSAIVSGPPAAPPRARLGRKLSLVLETYVALPLFALVLVAALWTTAFHFIDKEQRDARQAARDDTRELVDTYEAQMARSLAGIDQTLKLLKYAVEQDGASGALATLRRQSLLPPSVLFTVAVANRDGLVVASNPPARPLDVSRVTYFLVHRAADGGVPYVSQTLTDRTKAEPHLHFTRRINDASGRFAGVAIVEVDPGYFTSAYEHGREGERGLLGLVGADGVVRALRVGEQTSWGQRIDLARLPDGQVSLAPTIPDGLTRFLGVRRLHGYGLIAIVGLDADEQMAGFARQRSAWLAGAGIGTAVLLLVVTLVSAWSWQVARSRRRERRAQETYAAASEASVDAFFVLRTVWAADGTVADFAIEATNSRAEEMAGLPKEAMRGMLLCEMLPSYRRNGIFDAAAKVALEGGVDQAEWHAQAYPMRGRWLHRQVVPVEGGVVAIVRDITERKQAEERIVHMAHHDDLTGLPNRTLLRLRLEQNIAQAAHKGWSLALVFVDLDGFKLINDGLGHNAGDELLKVVGKRMRACLRRGDTLARFGGDEFVLLLPGVGAKAQSLAPLLEKLRQAVHAPVQVAGQSVQVSCSMGVVMYPRDGLDANTLLMNADAAMYRAKDGGRNNYQFYAREMNASGEENLILLDGLRQSLEATLAGAPGGGLSLCYQPKVDLKTGRVFGVEALLRWHHPEHGPVSPQRFIGLAEESGMIVELGEWALRTACRQNQAWRAAGLPPITVSVNVSPRQFEERKLVARVAAALRDSGLPPDALELEVTESLIMRDLAQSVAKMRDLEAMGVSLSIDDFGTGYSSLSALKSFPISRLKIDKSFVSELAANPDDQAIAMAVISLGHKLHLRVIAEGVETEEQCAFLRANDCDEMQGYLFSRPVPPARIAELLATAQQFVPAEVAA
ncbi:EAL domain-containing protein [Massilia solisilvae]|uniref:EAL domain-containing protein n=1 Tax=Massilia solisilvae TaxID=1811225 RepID=A0ABT2BKB0_9BURK|nr:EAL domain-containing protein [Massilia solisilvae]MCS0608939.1 EAL domain-containing protein [Massilia solisilvae]